LALTNAIAAAYSAGADAWAGAPERIYGRMAVALVERSPQPLAGRLVLDVGTGTGAGARAVIAVGGRVVAVDAAIGMLQRQRRRGCR
jgi:ubiquinone/menaquinone biosynthesis C-methylase UbiE